jgi:two-component system, OmpR family, alkaline phosphatase synthesis response regulator PhoP
MLKFLFSRIPEEIAQPCILLIDDDRDIRTVTSMVLLSQHIGDVIEASSGEEGIEAARTRRPDVILLDMRMPDMNGETVLRLLQTDPWTRDIPIVLFTGYAGDSNRLKTLRVSGIVMKPFQPQHLCEVIRDVLHARIKPENSSPQILPPESPYSVSTVTGTT